ncbi:MAG: hypothetical protein Q9162_007419 [Coniocarpon cinnabarinum]
MATSLNIARLSLQEAPTNPTGSVDYALVALREVESQRDAALRQVEKLTEQLQTKDAEVAALRARTASPRSLTSRTRQRNQEQRVSTGSDSAWLESNWLSCGGDLAPAEEAFNSGGFRNSIAMVDQLLENLELDNEVRLNAILLKAKALSETGLQYQALPEIFGAKRLASKIGREDLRAKSCFHEGICYYKQKNYQSALLSFSAATGTVDHEQQIQAWREKTESVLFGRARP